VEALQEVPFEVGAKRTVYTIGLVLSTIAFAITAFWVFRHLGFFPPVVLAMVMMAFGAITFAYLLATGPYVFRLDGEGFHDRSGLFQAGRIAWSEIESVTVVKAAGREQIGVLLTPEGLAARGSLVRELMKQLRAETGADIVIAPEAMGPEDAAFHVERLRRLRSGARGTV
jgi:hypothetical protein